MDFNALDPATGLNARALDFLDSFKFVVEKAIREKVEVFLIVGDLFDRVNPPSRLILEVMHELKKVSESGIITIVVGGNHETPKMATTLNPLMFLGTVENVHVVLEPSTVSVGDVDFVCVPSPVDFDEIKSLFGPMLVEALASSRSATKVLATHLPLSTAQEGSEKSVETFLGEAVDVSDIPALFKYVAVGHMHSYQRVPDSRLTIYYSGSSERCGFGEEHDRKFMLLVDLGREVDVKPFEIPVRNMITIAERDCSGMSADEIVKFALDTIDEFGSQLKGAIVRTKLENIDVDQNRLIDWSKVASKLEQAGVFGYRPQNTTASFVPESRHGAKYILPPSEELEEYINERKELRGRKKVLMELGMQIIAEVREAHQVET